MGLVGIGIIGCGRITEKHIATLSRLATAQVVALSDVSQDRMNVAYRQLRTAAPHNGEAAMYTDYELLLEHPEVDVVVITAANGQHADIAGQALLAGKHVIVEKPLALSLEDSRLLTQLARRLKLKLLVCHQMRYRLFMQRIRDYIRDGLLGKIHYGVASLAITRSPYTNLGARGNGTWEQDGGMLLNEGIHLVDLLLWYMGDLDSVYGELQKVQEGKEMEDIALAIFSFKNGAKGLIEANTITSPAHYGYSIRLFAEKGTVIVGGSQLDRIERFEVNGIQVQDAVLRLWEEDRDEQLRMYEAYIRQIQGISQPMIVDATEADRALEAIFAVYKSSVEGRKVTLPLSNFDIQSMKGIWQ